MIIELKNNRVLRMLGLSNFSIRIIKNTDYDHPVLPSIIDYDGYLSWKKDDKSHREGKPAVIYSNGSKHYFENGKFIKEEK